MAANINAESMLDFSHLKEDTRSHLVTVYKHLAMTTAAAAVGAYLALTTVLFNAGLLTALASLGCILMLRSTRGQNTPERRMYLGALGFFSGVSTAPLLEMAMMVDPGLPVLAFAASATLFACFSMAALRSTDRTFLYLGGTLASMLSAMFVLSIINIFVQSSFIYDISLYGGLLLFCGFTAFDTQLIVEKHRMGDRDAIWHAVDLFIDFLALFKRLLIILSKNSAKKNNERRRR